MLTVHGPMCMRVCGHYQLSTDPTCTNCVRTMHLPLVGANRCWSSNFPPSSLSSLHSKVHQYRCKNVWPIDVVRRNCTDEIDRSLTNCAVVKNYILILRCLEYSLEFVLNFDFELLLNKELELLHMRTQPYPQLAENINLNHFDLTFNDHAPVRS